MLSAETITQLFFVLSAFITMPLALLSFIYGKITGQINFRKEEEPSPFQKGKLNPSYNQDEKLPFMELHEKLLGKHESPNPNLKSPEKPEIQQNSNPGERPSFDPIKVLEKRRGIQTPSQSEEKTELKHEKHPKEETAKKENEETIEEETVPIFKSVKNSFAAKVTQDFQGKTEEGIPFTIKKDTEIQIVAPHAVELQTEKTEEEKKKKELAEDEALGGVK